MKMGRGLTSLNRTYHTGGNKLQELYYHIVPNLSPEHHTGTVREVYSILVIVKTAFK